MIDQQHGPCVPDRAPLRCVRRERAPSSASWACREEPARSSRTASAAFPRAGRSPLAVRLQPGENRVEATLVEAAIRRDLALRARRRAGLPAREPSGRGRGGAAARGGLGDLPAPGPARGAGASSANWRGCCVARTARRPSDRVLRSVPEDASRLRAGGRLHLAHDRVGGGGRVGGLGDGPAHHEVVGARGERRGRASPGGPGRPGPRPPAGCRG